MRSKTRSRRSSFRPSACAASSTSRSDGDAKLVDECTRTIIGEVEDLKRLVNEFSAFARMPHLNPLPGDLNALAEETVATFRDANPGVDFALALTPALPQIAIDRDALKRAMVNLLENAVNAAVGANPNGARPRIDVSTALDAQSGVVTLEVSDNGPGIRAGAAHADFRAVLFYPQGRHRPRPGDCLGHRRRPSWLRPGARQPAERK